MRLNNVSEFFISTYRINQKKFLTLLLAFAIGTIFGTFTVNGLESIKKEEMLSYLQGFFALIGNQSFINESLLKVSIWEYSKLYLFIWILGITIIGIPFIYICMCIKGFLTGFSSGFLIQALAEKGILFIILGFLPGELIAIPVYAAIGSLAVSFSFKLVNNFSTSSFVKPKIKRDCMIYFFTGISLWVLLLGASLIEAYIVPVLIRMVLPIYT